MENSNLDLMIDDFIKRHRGDATRTEIESALKNNLSLITDDAFFSFDIYFDRFLMFFAYVKPGVNARTYWDFFESYAKFRGCKKLQFSTSRVKAFQRCFPDYKQTAVIFEKGIQSEKEV